MIDNHALINKIRRLHFKNIRSFRQRGNLVLCYDFYSGAKGRLPAKDCFQDSCNYVHVVFGNNNGTGKV